MRLPLETRTTDHDRSTSVAPSVIFGIVLASVVVIIALYILLISLRTSQSNPRYIPTSFLKKRWLAWKPKTMKYRMFGFDPTTSPDNHSTNRRSRSGSASNSVDNRDRTSTTEMTTTDGVNRNTSVRSIMTLPPYRPAPLPTERLIAREGERAGVDTVIEFPENADEEEARREADMDELYQVRVARRQEAEERRERRHARRAAREAGDWARVEQLRVQARLAENARMADSLGSAGSSSSSLPRDGAAALLAEHHARALSRERRVSSVSYADLGLARHDGSRIRADSVESDHRPLLDSAASMGGSPRSSFFTVRSASGQRRRNASTGSILTTDSDNPPLDTPYTSNRSGSDPPALTPTATHASNDSDRNAGVPTEDPPLYEEEEAPPYASPVRDSAPQLQPLSTVPNIEVEGATPMSSRPGTPVERHDDDGR
ncbi:MAG: hypothetical protein LQ345_006792 [Seirophora villosa]|nr:MAG: hypothetical protein LQ345_006792 [Seirophora villosa]